MDAIALRFIKWSTGFLVLGLTTGYGPLGHYLMGGVERACPSAPFHGHVALLGWLGMTVFGLTYLALERLATLPSNAAALGRTHLKIAGVSVLGVWANGGFGYALLDWVSPSFYYTPDRKLLNLWLALDGAFLTLYGVGCLLLMWIVFKAKAVSASAPEPA